MHSKSYIHNNTYSIFYWIIISLLVGSFLSRLYTSSLGVGTIKQRETRDSQKTTSYITPQHERCNVNTFASCRVNDNTTLRVTVDLEQQSTTATLHHASKRYSSIVIWVLTYCTVQGHLCGNTTFKASRQSAGYTRIYKKKHLTNFDCSICN